MLLAFARLPFAATAIVGAELRRDADQVAGRPRVQRDVVRERDDADRSELAALRASWPRPRPGASRRSRRHTCRDGALDERRVGDDHALALGRRQLLRGPRGRRAPSCRGRSV